LATTEIDNEFIFLSILAADAAKTAVPALGE
jgi:hypothetical protein